MSSEVPETPGASCLCTGQGSIQATIRPGIWIPIIRLPHIYEEMWKVPANPVVCVKDVLQAVSKLQARNLHGCVFSIAFVEEKAERSKIEILVFSRFRYVFVIKLNFANDESAGSTARVTSFSSGCFPSWFPLNFLFSSLLFFLPFYDSGANARWITILRNQMTIPVEITKKGRKC